MRNKRFKYDETFPCCCAGGRTECGVLGLIRIDTGNIEIGFSTKNERYQGNSKNPHIYLKEIEIKKLIKSLQATLKERKEK